MAKRSLKFVISAEDRTGDALKKMHRGFKAVEAAVLNLRTALVALGAGVAITKLVKVYGEQERAEKTLTTALRNRNEVIAANSDVLKEQASALQRVTILGDEQTIAIQRNAIAMGLATTKASDLALASANLSAATGRSVDQISNQLIKTLGGYAGELAEVLPAIKALTAEQLKNGEAVDLINSKFKGFAEQEAKTALGQMQQLKNAVGDLGESFGRLFAPAVTSAANELRSLSEVFSDLLNRIGRAREIQAQQQGRSLPEGGGLGGWWERRLDAFGGRGTGGGNPIHGLMQDLGEWWVGGQQTVRAFRNEDERHQAIERAREAERERQKIRAAEVRKQQADSAAILGNPNYFASAPTTAVQFGQASPGAGLSSVTSRLQREGLMRDRLRRRRERIANEIALSEFIRSQPQLAEATGFGERPDESGFYAGGGVDPTHPATIARRQRELAIANAPAGQNVATEARFLSRVGQGVTDPIASKTQENTAKTAEAAQKIPDLLIELIQQQGASNINVLPIN